MTQRGWSGPTPFVGRQELLDRLAAEVDSAIEDCGRAVFLEGPAGSGKTAFVGVLQEVAHRRHRGLKTQYVNCAQSGEKTWSELARLFTRGHRLKRSARRVTMEWLDATQIGAVFTAIWRTVKAVRSGHVEDEKGGPRLSAGDTAVEAVRMLCEEGASEPRLVILDSLERGDAEDLAGAFALIQRLPKTRTAFLAVTRTRDTRPPTQVEDLILEAERLGRGDRVVMPALSAEEMRQAVEQATRTQVPDDWLRWLLESSRGLPGSLWSVLARLEDEGKLRRAGRGWMWEGSPGEARGAEAHRTVDVTGLDEEDIRLLTLAAVEGPVFHSAVVAELTGISELDLEDRFSRLCRTGLLEHREMAVGAELTSRYAFLNPTDATVFSAGCPETERAALQTRIQGIRARLRLPSEPGERA